MGYDEIEWIDVVQTCAIVVGFAITFWQLRDSLRLRRFDVFCRIGDSHREVWRPVTENPTLRRVTKRDAVTPDSITDEERFFVITVVIHVEMVRRAQLEGYFKHIPQNDRDIGELFNYPVVATVWEEVKKYQDRSFVEFVEKLRKKYLLPSVVGELV